MRKTVQAYETPYIGLTIFIASFLIYLSSLFPSVHFDDNPELAGALFNLGTAHPSGYPVYLLIAKLFTFLPIGTIAFKANLLSAILSSLSLMFLFLFLEKLSSHILLALISVIVFSISSSLWSQSIIGEVYTLNNLFISLIFYCSVIFIRSNQRRYLLLAAFLFGLGMTNHITLILIVPSIAAILFLNDKLKEALKAGIFIIAVFIIGYSTYLYLPLRAMAGPRANWLGSNVNVSQLIKHILISKDQNILYSQLANQPAAILLRDYFDIAVDYFRTLAGEFPPALFLFIPFGLVYLWKRERELLWFSLSLLAPFIALFILFCDPGREESRGVFVIPSFMAISIWIGSGIYYTADLLYTRGKVWNAVIYAGGTVLFITIFVYQFRKNDQSYNYLAYSYGKNILNTLGYKSSLNYYVGTQKMYLLFYLNEYVENYRNDIVYGADTIAKEGYDNYLYFKYPAYDSKRYDLLPAGFLYRLIDKNSKSEIEDYWTYYYLEDLEREENYKDIQSLKIRADYYFFQAEYANSKGNKAEAERLYDLAVTYNPELFFEMGKKFLRDGKDKQAKEAFLRITRLYPEHEKANYNLGILDFYSGDFNNAVIRLKKVKKADKVSIDAYYVLGKIFYDKKKLENAVYYWKKYISYKPSGRKTRYVIEKLKLLEAMVKEQ